jgi:protein AaeX
MIGEVEAGGVFIPVALVSGIIGFATSLILRRILRVAHVYTFVWHAGLFDVAAFVLLWAATDYLLSVHPILGLYG